MRTIYLKMEITGETEEDYSDACDELVIADFITDRIDLGPDCILDPIPMEKTT